MVRPIRAGEAVVRALQGERPEVAVGLVDDQRETAPPAEVREGRDCRRRVESAGRIVGADEEDRPNPPVEESLGLRGVGHEAGRRTAGQGHNVDAEHRGVHLMVEIPGHGQHDRLARLGDEYRNRERGHVAAGRDGDLVGTDPPVIEARNLGRIGLA